MSSRRFTALFLTALWFGVTGMLSGCGLKGPLYLPDSGREGVPVEGSAAPSDPEAPPAVSSEEKKRGTERAPASDTQTPVSPPDPARPASPTTDPQGN